ncbi:MAG: histidine triad nucleotide-binding protein [Acidobacteria bacterium ACB1]|nr:histidine triad nucleotide-binding protein [Deltaproteobacteria bacterium]MCE7961669.1 histidine triad nucleotide-binding protein [Acidobacteria bacterium ACB1]
MPNIFAKIIRKEIPAQIVFEDDRALAFKDIHPAAPFHVLVIPKKDLANVGAMTEDDVGLVGHLLWVCKKVAHDAGVTDFRVVSNSGEGSGQSVFHLHFHVLGDRVFRWPPG